MNKALFDTVITPDKSQFGLSFKMLRKYRDLIGLFVRRNFISTYKQSILGPLWILINPLMTSIVFTVIFGRVAGIASDGLPHILFYMAGNTMWTLFSKTVSQNANAFVSNRNIFSKVYFPRMTTVAATTLTAFVNFLIQFVMLLVFYVYYLIIGEPIHITLYWLMIPVLALQCMLLGTAVGILIASLAVKYRDFIYMVSMSIQLWMYATPIVYPLPAVGTRMRAALLVNPMTAVIQNFRYALYGRGELLTWEWGISALMTALLLWWGVRVFTRAEKDMIDTI